MRGLRASIVRATNPWGAAFARLKHDVLLPMMNRRLSVRSPILDVAPSLCLPPVDL